MKRYMSTAEVRLTSHMTGADNQLQKQDDKIEGLAEKALQQKFDIDKLMSSTMSHTKQIKEMQDQISKLF